MADETTAQAAAAINTNQTGTNGGYYYSFWTNGGGSVNMTLDGSNGYSVQWSNAGDFTCGKGWNPGSGHTISYSGSYTNSGGGAFGIYGWTTNPLVEYYIVEAAGNTGSPGGGTHVGTVTSDGSTYDIWKHQQVNQPCITGNSCTFWQYISVRQSKRTSGTITIQNHFNAWAQYGMNLGAHNYQILLTEGWSGSGNASAKVSVGGGGGGGTCSAAPSAPSGLNASAASSSQINLSWAAVSPPANCSVTYSVFRNGAQVASGLTGTSYSSTGLAASTSYQFYVRAVDSAGSSANSATVSATTQASGGGGGGGGSTGCKAVSGGQSGNFNTTGAICFTVNGTINGWGCSNSDGRTVTVNGTAVSCGRLPLPGSSPYTFSFSAGTYPWASFYWW